MVKQVEVVTRKVEAVIRLCRYFTFEGKGCEDEYTYEVFVSAEVVGDEMGPVVVVDVPDMDGDQADRCGHFAPLKGEELEWAEQALWEAWRVLDDERQTQEKRQAWEALARQRLVASVVEATVARVRLTRVDRQAFLRALAAELEAA